MVKKVVMTVFGLIALYLILANGNAFNSALKTAGNTAITGAVVLQGRDPKEVLA